MTTDGELVQTPPPTALSLDDFGASLKDHYGRGVTGQAVKYWIERSGLGPVTRSPRGAPMIADPAAARAWLEANLPESVHRLRTGVSAGRGGARANSGRKDGPAAAGTPGRRKRRRPPHGGSTDPADGGLLDSSEPSTPRHLETSTPSGSASAGQELTEAKTDLAREQLRKARLANDQAEGKLLDADDVRKTIRDRLTAVDSAMKSIPADAADRVSMRLGLTPEQRAGVLSDIDAAVTRARRAVAGMNEEAAEAQRHEGTEGKADDHDAQGTDEGERIGPGSDTDPGGGDGGGGGDDDGA